MLNLFKFRRYRKKQGKKIIKHPKLIIDESKNESGFMGLTSLKKKGKRHNNIHLIHNPQIVNGKRIKKQSYLRRKIEYDEINNFGEILNNYSLSDEDRKNVEEYIKKKLAKSK